MYPGVNPADSIQETESAGESQQMHEDALNGDLASQRLKTAVKQVLDEYAVTTAWNQQELNFEITCPSGQKCLARRLTTLDLIESDLLDEIDYFTKKLMPSELDAAGNPIDNEIGSFGRLLKDTDKRGRLFTLLDGLLHIGIVKPKIHLVPKDVDIQHYRAWVGPELPAGEVWANVVDFADKMFIFGELNKPLDEINTFRIESETSVADMAAVENISGEAK